MIDLTAYIYEDYHPLVKRYMIAILIMICVSPFQKSISILYILLSPLFIAMISYLIYPFSWLMLIFPKIEKMTIYIMNKLHEMMQIIQTYQINIRYHMLDNVFKILAYITILWILLSSTKLQRMKRVICLFIIFCIPSFVFNQINEDLFYMIDVGQGDGFYIKVEDTHILVDAFSQTTNFLENHGITHLDYLILTHSDYDHIKEAHEIIETFDVSKVLINAYDLGYDSYDANVRRIKANDQISINTQSIKFYNPIYDYGDPNNNSLVIKI